MRIQRRARASAHSRELKSDIAAAAALKGVSGRVCGAACAKRCDRCGGVGCQCACSPYCLDAPRALSIEPLVYPIEPAVTPLVYEMTRSGVFHPCWSCEGHLGSDGAIQKMPRVWFYCDSLVHVRLLANGLTRLRHGGRLSVDWRIAVTYSDHDNPETTFSLEPCPGESEAPSLDALQRDLGEIARALHDLVREEARALASMAAL